MGYKRRRPKHLAKKLRAIRKHLGLTQAELVKRLGINESVNNISKYEHDKNEPPANVMLAYARAVDVPLEQIVDDDLELTLSIDKASPNAL
jgi:transcriptional regulator with XRE-family HTH domain